MESKMSKVGRTRRQFTDEFKAGAVRLVVDEQRSISSVSTSPDAHPRVLNDWVLQTQADAGKGRPGAPPSAEKEELAQLRRENRTLRMERDILGRTAAVFAKEIT